MRRDLAAVLVTLAASVAAGCDDPPPPKKTPAAPSASVAASPAPAPTAAPAPPPVVAQAPPPPAVFGKDERAQLLETVERAVETRYATAPVGGQMAAAIAAKATQGAYDHTKDEADLARAVTADLVAAGHDDKVSLQHEGASGQPTRDEQDTAFRDGNNKKGGGFGVGGRLPGNVERLVLSSFEPLDEARTAVEDHMSAAADADALVLDLRGNTGGDPATVALLESYLFDAPRIHLDDIWWRATNTTEAYWTEPNPGGRRYGSKKPVLVLMSATTSGAAEQLAYDLKALHRAQLIGEKTAGVANPVGVENLAWGFTLHLPIGRVTNAVTKKSWDGTGVTPDLPKSAADSLRTGFIRALRAAQASPAVSPANRRNLEITLRGLGPEGTSGVP